MILFLLFPTASFASQGFHFLRFESGFIAAFQQSGGNSQSGFFAYTPQWESSFGLGIKLRAAGALYKSSASTLFVSTDATAFLTYHFPDVRWLLEVGGGLEVWFAQPQSYNPAVSAQLAYVFERRLWIFDRWVLGYRLTLLYGVPTHAGYVGLGMGI